MSCETPVVYCMVLRSREAWPLVWSDSLGGRREREASAMQSDHASAFGDCGLGCVWGDSKGSPEDVDKAGRPPSEPSDSEDDHPSLPSAAGVAREATRAGSISRRAWPSAVAAARPLPESGAPAPLPGKCSVALTIEPCPGSHASQYATPALERGSLTSAACCGGLDSDWAPPARPEFGPVKCGRLLNATLDECSPRIQRPIFSPRLPPAGSMELIGRVLVAQLCRRAGVLAREPRVGESGPGARRIVPTLLSVGRKCGGKAKVSNGNAPLCCARCCGRCGRKLSASSHEGGTRCQSRGAGGSSECGR